ncbi:helix-turn-helix transcriptional regulator [Streptomyces sp. MP131-18]|uniref:helix-turn-helix domain-containing protein n=1 Tax=Streptomyces sp. MP131-18 TaxID=1857892 RepID=UPI00097C14D7|nr:helix-turn-helix transcriptional regulator [Streptomyces sp. MP131-18]ONK09412.1 anaerobic benzoate catabolism transcriptional regulator [Streptomyces sp. MP131-18]
MQPQPLPPDPLLPRRLAVGTRIREARLRANCTQERLDDLTGIDRKTISRVENGHTTLTIDQLLDVADALGVSPRDLLPERPPSAPPE